MPKHFYKNYFDFFKSSFPQASVPLEFLKLLFSKKTNFLNLFYYFTIYLFILLIPVKKTCVFFNLLRKRKTYFSSQKKIFFLKNPLFCFYCYNFYFFINSLENSSFLLTNFQKQKMFGWFTWFTTAGNFNIFLGEKWIDFLKYLINLFLVKLMKQIWKNF